MAIWEDKDGKPDWWYIGLMVCVFSCCLIPSCPGGGGGGGSSPSYTPTTTTPTTYTPPSRPSAPSSSSTPSSSSSTPATVSPSVYWNARPNANGRDWYNATYTQKKWICDRMANVGNNTSAFWMNFFNEFYITNGRPDQATSSTTMDAASKLAAAASNF